MFYALQSYVGSSYCGPQHKLRYVSLHYFMQVGGVQHSGIGFPISTDDANLKRALTAVVSNF